LTIHSTAVIDPQAEIDPTAIIGPHAVIEGPVRISTGCRIGPSVVILGHTVIEAGCQIHSHAVIGDLPQDHAYHGAESSCHIGEGCTIREGVTIHRGTDPGSKTAIGARCLLMTNSHIAHNCELGEDVTIVSGALLAVARASRETFLAAHVDEIYDRLTAQRSIFRRLDDLAYDAAKLVPGLVPTRAEVDAEAAAGPGFSTETY